MTLVMFQCVGNDFVIATSDTKKTKHENGKYIQGEEQEKAFVLTNNSILGYGGVASLNDIWANYMYEHTEKYYFLDEIESVMEESQKFIEKLVNDKLVNLEETRKKLEEPDSLTESEWDILSTKFMVTGFLKNGNTGTLAFSLGESAFAKQEVPPGYQSGTIFGPSEDIEDLQATYMNYTNFIDLTGKESTYELSEKILEHLSYVHALIAMEHETWVSETMISHLLIKQHGKLEYFNNKADVSGIIEQLKNLT